MTGATRSEVHGLVLPGSAVVAGLFLVIGTVSADPAPYPQRTGGMGCVVEQLTDSELDEYQNRGVSQDGRFLAYVLREGFDENGVPIATVFVRDLQSGENQPIEADIDNSGAFSPDGRSMAIASHVDNGRTDILLLDLDTQGVTPIAPHEQWDWLPTFSPDGSTIVFNSYRVDGQADIFTYDLSSGALARHTDDPRYDAHGEFSPDGSKILFNRMIAEKPEGGYDFEMFVIDLDSGTETQISAGTPFEESYGSWAPDSAHVVFSSDQDGKPEKHNLYVLGPDGHIVARLTRGDWKDSYAYWSRDGAYIYFNSDRDGPDNIYRIPMNGLNCVRGGPIPGGANNAQANGDADPDGS